MDSEDFSFGLPTNGLINSESNNGFTYQLQPYNNNNVLKLQDSEIDTLYLETPKAFESISVLAATGSGQSSLNVRFVFEDGTVSNSYNTNVADWFGGQNYAIKGLDRVQRVENIVEQYSNDPRLYDRIFVLNGTDSQKKITKVVFEKTDANASFLGVFALCGVNNYSAPLPVDFISFELTKLGENVIANWKTTHEKDCKNFEIEYSEDGENWNVAGFVDANNHFGSINQYQFLHQYHINGTMYYRIKQNDFDGKFSYSKVEKIEIYTDFIQISPNPAENYLEIDNLCKEEVDYDICDMYGKEILRVSLRPFQKYALNVSEWAEGMYILSSNSESSMKKTVKIEIRR